MPAHPTRPSGPPAPAVQPHRVSPVRRAALLATLAAIVGGLSACGTPLPAVTWLRLPAEAAEPIAALPAPPGAAAPVWQLMAPLTSPSLRKPLNCSATW